MHATLDRTCRRGALVVVRDVSRRAVGRRAGRIRRSSRGAAPARAAEGQVGDGGETASSSRSASSSGRCGRRAGSSASATRTQQQKTRRPPGRDEQRARLPHQPHAEGAALEHQPGAGVQRRGPRGRRGRRAARAPALGARRRGGALGAHHVRAALRVELGDEPRLRERDQPTRRRPAAEGGRAATATTTNGTTWATVVSVHSAPRRRSARSSTRGRQWTDASSGSALGAGRSPTGHGLSRRRSAGA